MFHEKVTNMDHPQELNHYLKFLLVHVGTCWSCNYLDWLLWVWVLSHRVCVLSDALVAHTRHYINILK